MSPQRGTASQEMLLGKWTQTGGSEAVAELVLALGSAGFADKLLRQLNQITELNHLSLVHLESQERITYVLSASDDQMQITRTLQQLYLSIYYRLDPNKEFLQQFSDQDSVLVRRLRPQEINDLDYRQLWYEKMGIVDRLSILFQGDKGLYCLNLFRGRESFSDADIEQLTELAPLLAALALKHARLCGRLSSFMTRDEQIQTLIERLEYIESGLTPREKEVCARMLLGMSSEGIALDLAIKPHSVQTYRKRAYARLNISSQNELFSLCLTTG